MTEPQEPRDRSSADGPLGGTGRRYGWLYGLIALVVFLSVVSFLVGGTGGETNVPSR